MVGEPDYFFLGHFSSTPSPHTQDGAYYPHVGPQNLVQFGCSKLQLSSSSLYLPQDHHGRGLLQSVSVSFQMLLLSGRCPTKQNRSGMTDLTNRIVHLLFLQQPIVQTSVAGMSCWAVQPLMHATICQSRSTILAFHMSVFLPRSELVPAALINLLEEASSPLPLYLVQHL